MEATAEACTGCFRPGCSCLRMIAEPIVEGMWVCQGCWNPKDPIELAHYRWRFAIPKHPGLQCSFCGSLPPAESILAAAYTQAAPVPSGNSSDSGASKKSEQPPVPDRLAYSIADAAQLLGIGQTKMKDEIRDGKIAIVKVGKRRRILKAEINRYLLRNK